MQRRPGRYTDRHGSEEIVFESDGRDSIRTTIRGAAFGACPQECCTAPCGSGTRWARAWTSRT
ncbi:DUF6304 family protein [Streptomyces regalis]|uniref:DUF6304 family protein n=1 Tax=Streptomyces regalis TaxID=68262 RepID=UPI003133A436